jgi:hypothetical protein
MTTRAKGKWSPGVPKPPKDYGAFERGIATRKDVLGILEMYHQRTVVPFVQYMTAPFWKRWWWQGTERWKAWRAKKATQPEASPKVEVPQKEGD